MTRSGSGHRPRSVMRPNCTSPSYDRIDTPIPMSPDCGTQNIRLLDTRTGHVERLLRTGHVGHHGGRVAREDRQQLLLQQLGSAAHRGEQSQREDRLVAALQRIHVRAHRVEALDRVLDADRQVEEHEAELVAELVGLLERAQVDRHQRAHHRRRRRSRPCREVVAQRTGDAGQQHVVDRAPSAWPIAFTSGSGSGSAQATRLATPGVPLKRVGESCAHQRELRDLGRQRRPPCSASATAFAGSCQIPTPLSTSRRADPARGLDHA